MHREEGFRFADVVTLNPDDFVPLQLEHRQSYGSFMRKLLFDHIDIDPANTHGARAVLSKIHAEVCDRP